jgi:hypothetical protein
VPTENSVSERAIPNVKEKKNSESTIRDKYKN